MESGTQDNHIGAFDSHAHIYSSAIIASVLDRQGLAQSLQLNIEDATSRTDKSTLRRECGVAGVQCCLLLPTAPVHKVAEVNDLFLQTVQGEDTLITAGTLHPSAPDQDKELDRIARKGIRALKLCSFSQGFDLEAPGTLRLFEMIRTCNISGKQQFYVVLDTFYRADVYFGAPRPFITTPGKLARLASAFPEINFVAAHMGGLAAPFSEIEEHLSPRRNLFLDTSNAAHLLSRDEFVRLTHRHGPDHILFGTDWPWFGHKEEVAHIVRLLQEAGLSAQEQSRIFSGNARSLLGI